VLFRSYITLTLTIACLLLMTFVLKRIR